MSDHILQITDPHLFSDKRKRLRGVPTYDCLVDVLEHLRASKLDPKWVVLSGDLAHDEQRETYILLRSLLEPWLDRLLVIPGNHDNRESIKAVFGDQFLGDDCPEPYTTFSCNVGRWLLLGLDSHVPGQVAGRVATEQLQWMDKQLECSGDRQCLLFLHHPPISIESAWLDKLGLLDPAPLLARIHRHRQIAAVVAGHVHQDFSGTIEGRPFYTTPSTAMQFTPGQQKPSYDTIPCGYRVFELDEANWTTRVIRLPRLRFPPAPDGVDKTEN
jgi:Icc protein